MAVTAMLVIALQTINVPRALGDDGALVAPNPASDFPLSGVDATAVEAPSVLYGGALWTIDETRVTEVEGLLERSTVEVDVTLTNTLSNAQLRIPDSIVTLVADDGNVATGGRFVDAGARLAIEPGDSLAITVNFEVGFTQQPDLADLSLRIAEPNRIPALLRLGNDRDEQDSTIFAAVDTTPATIADPDDATRQIVLEPAAASIDVNAGPYRAALGEQLAVVKVNVQRAEASDDAGFLSTGYWALSADGETVPAILAAGIPQAGSNVDEITLLFAFPEGAEDLAVVAGADRNEALSFDVVLPG